MGFRDALDALLGTARIPEADTERLFAITTATVTMQASLDLAPAGRAALCFKPIESSRYDEARKEIDELLQYSCRETRSTCRVETDRYRFTWVILEDPDFDDIVAGIHLVSQTLIERGFGPYLLCAVYRFDGEKTVFWIYNFKQGRYYPFVPTSGTDRDTAYEFRLRSLLDGELPVEKEVERWYPLWDIPL
jgi:hypothetical protein